MSGYTLALARVSDDRMISSNYGYYVHSVEQTDLGTVFDLERRTPKANFASKVPNAKFGSYKLLTWTDDHKRITVLRTE